MRRFVELAGVTTAVALLGGTIVLCTGAAQAGVIDPSLDRLLQVSAPDATVSALVYLVDQVDMETMKADLDAARVSRQVRHEVVVRALQDVASQTQGEILASLEAAKADGSVSTYHAYWISNVIHVEGTPAALRTITNRADVDIVYLDYGIENTTPAAEVKSEGRPLTGGPEPGIEAVRAPEVWALGITGEGVLTSTLDTGVDGNHPALMDRWRGNADPRYAGNPEWAWFDPVTNTTYPQAFGSHGTHTMGTVCGGAPGDQVGVAPGAQWIHCAVIDRISIARTVADALLSFEWLLDPDGNPTTTWDVPQVCSNSWRLVTGHGYPPCEETFWQHLDNCEAAGICIIFSAGNEGAQGLGRPPDRATDEYRCFSVAAVDGNNPNYPIAGFSSRGPTFCTPDGSEAIKPDIAAPGVNVRSAVPGTGYSNMSGTSMASPHINGVCCLMLQANPDLGVDEMKQIIFDTALDLGASGEDNAYGYGIIDAYGAVTEALARTNISFVFPDGLPQLVDPYGDTTVPVHVVARQEEPQTGTGMFYYRSDGGDFTVVAMDETGENEYEAVFPTFDCGDKVEFYFSAETEGGETVYNPFGAPGNNYSAEAYTGTGTTFADDFETDMGWEVNNDQGVTGGFERGTPEGGTGAPTEDSDGSGQCYMTGISPTRDLDNGSTRLDSPDLDATSPIAVLAFDYWFYDNNNNSGDLFILDVSDDGGQRWVYSGFIVPNGTGGWIHEELSVSALPVEGTDQFRVRFRVSDSGQDSRVEAAIDAVEIRGGYICENDCAADLDGDGEVGFNDVLQLLAVWGACGAKDPCPEDLDEDGEVGFNDLLLLLAAWGPCK